MNEKKREVPVKNYFILFVILVVTFLLLVYFYSWFDKYEETLLSKRFLDKYMLVINDNELDNYLVENPNTILYVSELNNEKIREFEKLLKNKYKNDVIDKDILYLDITDVSEKDRNYLSSKYYFNNLNILSVPCIVVFREGNVDSIYSISSSDYDIDSFISYVNQISFDGDNND